MAAVRGRRREPCANGHDQVDAKKDHGGDGGIHKLSSTTEIVGRRVE
jgi:hypothetical protein